MTCGNQGSGLLTATAPEELTYLLHATLPRARANLSKEKGIRIENKQGNNLYMRKGKKEGGREERKEGLAPKCGVRFPIYSCYLQRFAGLDRFTRVGFQKVVRTVQFTDFSCNTLQTQCHCVHCADDKLKMLRIPPTCRFELQKVAKIASNLRA